MNKSILSKKSFASLMCGIAAIFFLIHPGSAASGTDAAEAISLIEAQVRDHRGLPSGTRPLKSKDRERLDLCVDRMLYGPTKKKVKVRGHQFNCKPHKKMTKSGNFYKVEGTLSHHLSARRDDQVKYSFLISSSGEMSDLELDIERGGIGPTIKKIASLGNKKVQIGGWYADRVLHGAGLTIEGGWRGSASLIVGTMALRVQQSVLLANAGRRGGNHIYYFVDRPGSDYRQIDLPKSKWQPEFCQNLCGQDNQCRAWTFNKRDPKKGPGKCFLKNRVGRHTISNRAFSGIKGSGGRGRRR